MTERRAHPARRARAVTGGLSLSAAAAMIAAMGIPAAGAPGTTTAASAAPAGVSAEGPAVPVDPGTAAVPAVGTTPGTRLRIVVRRHHAVAGRSTGTAALEPVQSVVGPRPPARAPVPAPAPRRSTRSGGS